MTLYEMTPAGPRPLSLPEAARAVYDALNEACPGFRTRIRLMGLKDLARELEEEQAEEERAIRRARYELMELSARERHANGRGRLEAVRKLEPRGA